MRPTAPIHPRLSTPARLGLVLLLWLLALPALAGVTARLDRDRVVVGDTVQLRIEASGRVRGRPDTTPLEKDFEVLGMGSGSSVTVINGRVDARTTWTVTLRPRRTGRLTIPPLAVAGEKTPPLTLTVTQAPVATPATGGDLFLETELRPAKGWEQGQFLYIVRVFYRNPIRNGDLSEPRLKDAIVRRLGDDREYGAQRGGVRYNVLERRYAIFPQSPGRLTVPAPVLDAEVVDPSRRRRGMRDFFGNDPFFNDPFFRNDPFDQLFAPTRHVRVRGEARTAEVQPRPAGWQGPWLPAQGLQVSQAWQPPGGQVRVGEPVTRIVRLSAQGLTGEQLPDLTPADVPGARVYPDPGHAQDEVTGEGIVGRREQRIAYVPERAGQLELPPVEVRWFDVRSGQPRTARLPGLEVTVLPAPAGQTPPPAPAATPRPANPPAPSAAPAPGESPAPAAHAPWWRWWWLLVLAGVLAGIALWRWRQRSPAPVAARPAATPSPVPAAPSPQPLSPGRGRGATTPAGRTDPAPLRRRFLDACRANDPAAARKALLAWAAAHWPDDPPRGLKELAERLPDPAQREALHQLDRAVFGGGAADWHGARLAELLDRLPDDKGDTGKRDETLPDLYPE